MADTGESDFSYDDLGPSRNEEEETVTSADLQVNPASVPVKSQKGEKKEKKDKKESALDGKEDRKVHAEADKVPPEQKLDLEGRTTAMVVYAPGDQLKVVSAISGTAKFKICVRDLPAKEGQYEVRESGHSGATCAMVVHIPAATVDTAKFIHSPVVLTACREDRFISVWNIDSMEVGNLAAPFGVEGHNGGITSLAVFEPTDLFPDMQPLLVTGGTDATAVVWFLHDGNYWRTLKGGHSDEITALAVYAPNKSSYHAPGQNLYPMLITASKDKTAAVWDLSSDGEKKHVLANGHTDGITALTVQISHLTKIPLLFSGSSDKSVTVWDLSTFTIVHTIQGAHEVSAIYFHVPYGVPLAELQKVAAAKTKLAITDTPDDQYNGADLFTSKNGADTQAESKEDQKVPDRARAASVAAPSTTAGARPASVRFDPATADAAAPKKSLLNSFSKRAQKELNRVTSMKFGSSPLAGDAGGAVLMTPATDTAEEVKAGADRMSTSQVKRQQSMTAKADGGSVTASEKTAQKRASKPPPAPAAPKAEVPAAPALTAMMIVESASKQVVCVWDLNTCKRLRVLNEKIESLFVYAGSGDVVTATPMAIDDEGQNIWNLIIGKDVPYNPATQALLTKVDHEKIVLCMAVSTPAEAGTKQSSNPFIVTGHHKETASVWDMATGEMKMMFEGDGGSAQVTAVAIHDPDSQGTKVQIITASTTGVTVWPMNSNTGEHHKLNVEAFKSTVVSIVVYPGSKKPFSPALVAVGLADGKVMVFDATAKEAAHGRILEGGHSQSLNAIALYVPREDPDREEGAWHPLLLSAGTDRAVQSAVVKVDGAATTISSAVTHKVVVWDLITGQRSSRHLQGHDGTITSLAVYNPEDLNATPLVVTGSLDASIIVWDIKSGEKVQVLKAEHGILCLSIYAPPNAKAKGISPLIVSVTNHGIQVWDLASGALLRTLKDKSDAALSLALFPYSYETASLPVIITANNKLRESRLWNLNSKISLLHGLEGAHKAEVNKVTSFALSVKGQTETHPVAVTVSSDTTAVLWDLETGIMDRVLQDGADGHTGAITHAAVHTGAPGAAPRVVTAGADKFIVVWNYETGKVEHRMEGHTKDITCLEVVNGKMQVITGSADGHAVVWDLATGAVSMVLIGSAAFGTVSRAPPEAARQSLWRFDDTASKNAQGKKGKGKADKAAAKQAATAAPKKLDLPAITAMAMYTEGKEANKSHFILIAVKKKGISLWSLADAKELRTFNQSTAVSSLLALNPKYCTIPVVVAVSDKTAVSWDVKSGAQLKTFSGHTEAITGTAMYLPSDTKAQVILVTVSKDQSAILWDLRSGAKLRILNHAAPVNSVTVSTCGSCDGDFLVTTTTTGGKATTCVWQEYAMDSPPLSESVHSLFITDSETKVNETYTWDRIKNVASISSTFWVENAHLFTSVFSLEVKVDDVMVVDKMRVVSFYTTFADALPGVIDRLPLINDEPLLKYVLAERIPVHQIILDAWIIALEKPCDTFVQQVFHPHTGLYPCTDEDENGLLLLAKLFPGLFIEFICKIKMVKSHPLLHAKCLSYVVPNTWIVEGMKPEVSSNMWSQAEYYTDTSSTSAQTVTAYMIPLTGVADIGMLKAFVDTSIALDDLSVFESHVGIAAFDYAWETFGRTVHLWTLFRYGVFLSLFSTSVVTFDRLETSSIQGQRGVAWAMQGLILLFTASYLLDELVQFRDSHLRAHLLKMRAKGRNALGAGVQKLQNIFGAGGDAASGQVTVPAKPAVVKQSVKDRKIRSKRGSVLSSIPAGYAEVPTAAPTDTAASTGTEMTEVKKKEKRGSTVTTTQIVKAGTDVENPPSNTLAPSKITDQPTDGTLASTFDTDKPVDPSQRTWNAWIKSVLKVDRKTLKRKFEKSWFMALVEHFCEFWNLLDMLVIVLVGAGTILRCVHRGETNSSRCVLAVASVFAWFKLLYFMRPFKRSGLLVSMILQIMSDIKYFLIVLAIALTGFALAFWIISYPDTTLNFGTIPNAFLNTYQYMLGQGINAADFDGTASPELGVLLLVMFMLFMMILMLNLLIALMGDSFSTIKSRGEAHWRREQASIILEQYSMVPEKTRQKVAENCHIHILKYFALTHDDELTDAQLLRSLKKALETKETEADERVAALENKVDLMLALLNKISVTGETDKDKLKDKQKDKPKEGSAGADKEKGKE